MLVCWIVLHISISTLINNHVSNCCFFGGYLFPPPVSDVKTFFKKIAISKEKRYNPIEINVRKKKEKMGAKINVIGYSTFRQ